MSKLSRLEKERLKIQEAINKVDKKIADKEKQATEEKKRIADEKKKVDDDIKAFEQKRRDEENKRQEKLKPIIIKKAEVVEEPSRVYNHARTGSKFNIRYWQDLFKDKLFGNRTVLVNMELSNGFRKVFIVVENQGGFRYRKKRYIFDNESKYYVMDTKLYCYDFHEDFTIPIKRHIPVSDIKKAIEMSNITEVENATNPATLDRFLKAKIAEGIMKGQQLDLVFRQLKLIGIITVITVIIHLILFVFKTGMLSSIKIPGIN